MIEAAAESSEELMNKYLEDGRALRSGNHQGVCATARIACEIQPMLCGTAFKNKGVQRMLDAVLDFLPSPIDIPPVTGELENGEKGERRAADDEKFSPLAFKIMTDPFVGQLIFFRVYSGVVNSGDTVLNATKDKKERLGRILQMHANQREEIKEVSRGRHRRGSRPEGSDHGRYVVRSATPDRPRAHDFPEPVISQAVEPKTKLDQEKMGLALQPSGSGRPVVPRPNATKNRAKPSFRAWASSTSKFWSTV